MWADLSQEKEGEGKKDKEFIHVDPFHKSPKEKFFSIKC